MAIKITGLDEFRRKLERLSRNVENVSGTVAFDDLFPLEFMRRYTDFVYSVAMRVVADDAHLAQDVIAAVFTKLAHHAAALARHNALAGWLHTTTRRTAIKLIRGEARRRAGAPSTTSQFRAPGFQR